MKYIKYIALVLIFCSCEEEFPWDFNSQNKRILVVDALLTNHVQKQHVRLSYSNHHLNETVKAAPGAKITVSDNDHIFTFTEANQSPGTYNSDSAFGVVRNKTYTLQVVINTDTFSATTAVENISTMSELNYSHYEKTGLYTINKSDESIGSMIKISVYSTAASTSPAATFYQYYLGNLDINKEFAPAHEKILIQPGARVIRIKYSLTTDYQEFLRGMLMETEWRGGVFDVQPGLIKTNISNGAMGYFTASLVLSDTTLLP